MKPLPIFELAVSDDPESDLQVTAIALVDNPAIERNWFAFKEQTNLLHFSSVNEEEQIIVGAAMIPDMKIYRNDEALGEYQIFFSKDTVKQIAETFFRKNFQGRANIMHDAGQFVEGVTYFLSWIKDEAKGMVGLEGDYPDGTWFVGAKVSNPEVWAKIKAGEIKGFSVEGMFEYKQSKTEDDVLLEKIKEILNGN